MMKRWIGFTWLFVLLSAAAASGQDKADAVYLDILDEYTLNADGGTVHRHAHKVRLLTNHAFHSLLGESFIVYDPVFQELEIKKSVTTMADGKEVASTPNAFNEVLPGFCGSAPPYTHLREMVVTHLGLEKGAVIHLDYEIRSLPGYRPFLDGQEVFSSPFPIERKTVRVKVPRGTALSSRMLHHDAGSPAVEEKEGFTVHTWTLTGLPMTPPEAMGKDPADYAPALVFSTCPSWKEAAGLMNKAFVASSWLDEQCEETVRALQTEAVDLLDLVQALNRFVVDEVATARIDPAYLGYRILPSKDIYREAVGSPMDKAALLTAMLRFAGVFAEPVLVSRSRAVAPDVPGWSQFDDCRVICTLRQNLGQPLFFERLLFLSPERMVEGVYEEDLAGRTVFRPSLLNNQLLEVSPSSEKENEVKASLRLTLNGKNQLSGDLSLEVKGSLNPYLSVIRDPEGWAKGRLKRLLPGGEVTGVRSILIGEHKSLFKGSTGAPAALEAKHGLIEYMIPSSPGGVMDLHVPVDLTRRATPMRLPKALSEEVDIAIELPEHLKVLSLPPPLEMNTAVGTLRSGAWVEEGVLHIRRAISLSQSIPAEDYPALRELLVEWQADDSRRVVLKAGES